MIIYCYQQELQSHALEIAKLYTVDKDRWIAEATQFRVPYWDWASQAVPPDEVIRQQQVAIITPDSNGKKVLVPNPFLHYTFHPVDPSFEKPFASWRTTLRHPKPVNSPNAKSDVDELITLVFPPCLLNLFLTISLMRVVLRLRNIGS